MDSLPRNAGHGPPLEATDAVLAGIFQSLTDHESMMPLPLELLQFVGMHNPELADSLYHLRLADNTPTQGLVGENVRNFMSNWVPNSSPVSSTAPRPALTHWHPSAPPTAQEHESQTTGTILGPNDNNSATGVAGATGATLPSLPIPSMSLVPPMLTMQRVPGRDSTPSALSIPDIIMTPFGSEAANMSTHTPPSMESSTPRFAAGPASPTGSESPYHQAGNTQYHFSGQTSSSAVSRQGTRSFHDVIGESAMSDSGAAVPRTVVHPMPAQAGFVTGADVHMANDDEWRPAGNTPRDMHIRQPIVLPSISHFFHDIPFPSAVPPAPKPAPEKDITWDWATIPSSFEEESEQEDVKANIRIKSEPDTEASAEASMDVSTDVDIKADTDANNGADTNTDTNTDNGPVSLRVLKDTLANGVYPEWNKIGISFQLITGHLNHEHIESAGSGFIEVMDYLIHNSKTLGIIPQSLYIAKDAANDGGSARGKEVALRDLRSFWSHFYYVARYTFTEQILRTKAVRAILAEQEEKRKRDAAAAGELVEDDKENEAKEKKSFYPFMGPDMWWSFGQILDVNWGDYFKHFFKNQTIPKYLTPWFSQADVRFVSYTDAELAVVAEVKAKQLAELAERDEEAKRARQAELAARNDQDEHMEDADEKENTAPKQQDPALLSYDMITRMQNRLESLYDIMYPRRDKPSQGESDNILPGMYFRKLLLLASQCTEHHPWKLACEPVVHVALRRLSDDHRDTHMVPLEFYGHAL